MGNRSILKKENMLVFTIYMLYSERKGDCLECIRGCILCGVQHCPLHIVDSLLGIGTDLFTFLAT